MNIDLFIIGSYLIITVIIGYTYSKGVQTIQEFALGNRYFSTPALAATITSTYVSGSSFIVGIQYGYYDGLLKFFSSLGIVLNIIMIIYIFLPRMSEFLGDLSIPTSLRKIFGKRVGLVSAIFSVATPVGMIAMQLKILSSILGYFTAIDSNILTMICSAIMILYSTIGGIRSVIMTDILQFVTFMIVVPAIGIVLWYNLSNTNPDAVAQIYNHATTFESVSKTDYITLFLLFLLPGFDQAFFQRITASKSIEQAKNAFKYSSYIYFVYIFLVALIGIMLFVYDSNLSNKADIFLFLINNFTFPGFTGLICIAIIAMSISTANSHLNSFGVIFSHDICKQLNILMSLKKELQLARLATILIGIIATLLAIYYHDILQILIFVRNFYDPIISTPLILAILGFRSSERTVLISMASGFTTVITWKIFQYFCPEILIIDSLAPSVSISCIAFLTAHYSLGESGGWIDSKNINDLCKNNKTIQKQKEFDGLIVNEANFLRLSSMLNSQINLRENNLRIALNMQTDILHNINHEIRTPIRTLRSNIDLLVDHWKDPYMQNHIPDIITSIKNSLNRFFKYASNMSDLSKYQTSKMILDIKSTNLKEHLQKITSKYSNISLHYYDNVPSYIECDELKITQLIEQIVYNSNSFRQDSKVQISVTITEDLVLNNESWERIKISFKDNGIGVPENELEDILLDSAEQGMGLAIAYEIINYHQGNIWATNNKNNGLIIHAQLPVKQPQYKFLGQNTYNKSTKIDVEDINVENIITQIKTLDNKFNGKIPKVLIIDDEFTILNSGEMIIRSLGFDFKGISNGEEAIKYIQSKEFNCDIILLDMMMGNITGFDVMKETYKILEEKKVPVIIQSGLPPHDNDIKQTLQLGAVELLSKPYHRTDVDNILKKYLVL